MIHIFYTLPEATRRLRISEEQIEAMLAHGILREFREGPHRLVKAADVEVLAASLGLAQNDGQLSRTRGAVAQSARPSPSRQVRLPRCAAVTVSAGPRVAQRPRSAGRTSMPGGRGTDSRVRPVPRPEPRTRSDAAQAYPPRVAARPSRAPVVSTSARQWLWEGLLRDRPIAIATLFGLVLLTLMAVGAGAYALLQVL